MKHTPGPWKIIPISRTDMQVELGNMMHGSGVLTFGSTTGTLTGMTFSDSPESEANARLIAAAPEMLQALKNLYSLANIVLRREGSKDDSIRHTVRVLIAKIEGDTK